MALGSKPKVFAVALAVSSGVTLPSCGQYPPPTKKIRVVDFVSRTIAASPTVCGQKPPDGKAVWLAKGGLSWCQADPKLGLVLWVPAQSRVAERTLEFINGSYVFGRIPLPINPLIRLAIEDPRGSCKNRDHKIRSMPIAMRSEDICLDYETPDRTIAISKWRGSFNMLSSIAKRRQKVRKAIIYVAGGPYALPIAGYANDELAKNVLGDPGINVDTYIPMLAGLTQYRKSRTGDMQTAVEQLNELSISLKKYGGYQHICVIGGSLGGYISAVAAKSDLRNVSKYLLLNPLAQSPKNLSIHFKRLDPESRPIEIYDIPESDAEYSPPSITKIETEDAFKSYFGNFFNIALPNIIDNFNRIEILYSSNDDRIGMTEIGKLKARDRTNSVRAMFLPDGHFLAASASYEILEPVIFDFIATC
jgi:hypothetical protein